MATLSVGGTTVFDGSALQSGVTGGEGLTNIQMDSGILTTGSSITTTITAHADTGFGVLTVTPRTTSAKVFLNWTTSTWTSSDSYAIEFFVYRSIAGGAYALISPNDTWGLIHNDRGGPTPASISWNDEPNTLNEVLYKLYVNLHSAGGTGYVLRSSATATRSLICVN